MGSEPGGIVSAHLKRLREATLKWLDHEDKLTQEGTEKELYLVQLAEDPDGAPEQPEPLTLLRRLRRFNLNLYSGGFLAQPHIALMEFREVQDAESEHHLKKLANQALKQLTGANHAP